MQSVKGGYESEETKRMLEQVSSPKGARSSKSHKDRLHKSAHGRHKHKSVSPPSNSTSKSPVFANSMASSAATKKDKMRCYKESSPSSEPSTNDTLYSASQSGNLNGNQVNSLHQEDDEALSKVYEISLDQQTFQIPALEAMFLLSSMSRFGKSISSIQETFGK